LWDATSERLLPFAVETYGRVDDATLAQLRTWAASKARQVLAAPPGTEPDARRLAQLTGVTFLHWRRVISAAVAEAFGSYLSYHLTVCARSTAAAPRGGGAETLLASDPSSVGFEADATGSLDALAGLHHRTVASSFASAAL
jgi:hypothetical protein